MTDIITYGGFIEVVNNEHYEFYYDCTKEKFSTIEQFVNWAVNQLKAILENDHFEIDESELKYFTDGLYTYNEGRRSYVGKYRLTEELIVHCEMFEKVNR